MSTYRKLLILGLLIVNPIIGKGQLAELLTLEASNSVALHRNFGVRSAEFGLQQRDAQVMGAYSAILPSVSISSGRSRYLQGTTSNIGNVQGIDENGNPTIVSKVFTSPYFQRDNNSFGMSFRQNIYDGGKWWNNISRAKSYQTASSHGVKAAKNEAVYNTTQSYLELAKAKALQYALFDAVMLSQEQLERTESLYELGSVARTDFFKAKVQLGNDRSNLLNQQNVVAFAKSRLNIMMGRDPLTQFRIEEVEYPKVEYPSREKAMATALDNNPLLKQKMASIQGAEDGKKVAKSAFLPSLTGYVNYNRNNEDVGRVFSPSNISDNWSSSLGLSLNFNLFNGFADKANLEESQAIYRSTREDYESTKRDILALIDNAITRLETFEELDAIFADNKESAEEDLRLATERYELGSATLLEVQDAQVALLRSNTSTIRNKYDYQIAHAQLLNAMGTIRTEK
ncbi:MAG: TolC family protein [Candidatus Marinimicrobia bacterium]|nr:TolC family protein [Candidatus Neomarinimicrobiota bacterium]